MERLINYKMQTNRMIGEMRTVLVLGKGCVLCTIVAKGRVGVNGLCQWLGWQGPQGRQGLKEGLVGCAGLDMEGSLE